MIQTVQFTSFTGKQDDLIVLQRRGDDYEVTVAFPFHEDMPNLRMTVPEALNLKSAIDNLILVKQLEAPLPPIVDETVISYKVQSELSGLFDRYPTNTDVDRTACKVLHDVIHILGL
ncbi:hypothetical protein AB9M62_57055 [Bacillales bacterium AN1005]